MKPYFSLLILILSSQLSAQSKIDTPQYRYAFKGYLNFLDVKKNNDAISIDNDTLTTAQRNSTLLPTIAFAKYQKNGTFWEFSLTKLSFLYEHSTRDVKLHFLRDSLGNLVPIGDIPTRGSDIWTNTIGLRFDWNMPLFYKKSATFQPYIGFSTDPSLFNKKIKPTSSAAFPTRISEFSNTFTIIPRLTYAFSKRLFMDINMPISFLELTAQYRFEDNPILPTFARKTFNVTARLPTNFWAIRLGIGYKI